MARLLDPVFSIVPARRKDSSAVTVILSSLVRQAEATHVGNVRIFGLEAVDQDRISGFSACCKMRTRDTCTNKTECFGLRPFFLRLALEAGFHEARGAEELDKPPALNTKMGPDVKFPSETERHTSTSQFPNENSKPSPDAVTPVKVHLTMTSLLFFKASMSRCRSPKSRSARVVWFPLIFLR